MENKDAIKTYIPTSTLFNFVQSMSALRNENPATFLVSRFKDELDLSISSCKNFHKNYHYSLNEVFNPC